MEKNWSTTVSKSKRNKKFNWHAMGRPLKGRNIPGCSVVISRRLYFRVLYGINQFQNQFSKNLKPVLAWRFWIFEYFALKTSFKIGFICLKPVYARSTRKCRWSEMAPEHPACSDPWEGDPWKIKKFTITETSEFFFSETIILSFQT